MSDLSHVAMRLGGYYAPEEAQAWLHTPHPQLGGERPVDLVQEGRTEEVTAILDRLDADAYL